MKVPTLIMIFGFIAVVLGFLLFAFTGKEIFIQIGVIVIFVALLIMLIFAAVDIIRDDY